ncbi:MAG: hypothetical protein AMJ84_04005 [Acidithiobacillales bacterium SM23_46]|nr:MAG: hypothetical protein AMJ84_04005 [Acidithiobacillales bacterium SM23_46]
MPVETALLAALVLLFAYLIRGISGFGSGLIAVPLLALLLPLTFVVPLILLTDFVASAILGQSTRKHIRWSEIRILLPTSALGVIVGATLLVGLPERPLLVALGVFVLFFGLRNALNLHSERPIARGWALPAGLVGGTVSGLFGTGGPPYVIYLSHRIRDKSELRATFSGLFLIEGGLRVAVFLLAGLLWQPLLMWAVPASLPLLAAGLYLGNRVHLGLTPTQMVRIIGVLLLVSGTSLLWKAWS